MGRMGTPRAKRELLSPAFLGVLWGLGQEESSLLTSLPGLVFVQTSRHGACWHTVLDSGATLCVPYNAPSSL